MILSIVMILAGFVLLMAGANYLVQGSVAIANKLKIPSLIVGLTVVAFGTSAPEFVVSITSAFKGSAGLAIGNVVGSNIANILLILGISALVYPIAVKKKEFYRDFSFLLFVTLLFIAFALTGTFTHWMGIVMLALLILFLFWNYHNSKSNKNSVTEDSQSPLAEKKWWLVIAVTVISLVTIIYGADLLVDGAVNLARYFGVSEELIGLTIVAFGTSLPELATSAVAAYRKQSDIAIGNILGSNIWNIVFIMGATASIINVEVTPQIISYDMWVMFASTLILLPIIYKSGKISRLTGIIFFAAYIAYLASQVLIASGRI